jgi:uncharacterized protein with PQ loop repeat
MKTGVSAIAAILTAVAFIPQAYKIIQSRKTATAASLPRNGRLT